MHGGYFSYALLAALAMALLVAAVTDLRHRRIDNTLNAAIALSAPLWWLSSGFSWLDAALQIGLAAATLAVTATLFAMRQMGGGDVKLLSALALWIVPRHFAELIVLMAVIGGGASLAMAACNLERRPGESLRDLAGTFAAFCWVSLACVVAWSLASGQPVASPALLHAIFPRVWIGAVVGIIVLAIVAFGLRHVLRRQKAPLRVPYGIAISAAGLWVVGLRALSTIRGTPISG